MIFKIAKGRMVYFNMFVSIIVWIHALVLQHVCFGESCNRFRFVAILPKTGYLLFSVLRPILHCVSNMSNQSTSNNCVFMISDTVMVGLAMTCEVTCCVVLEHVPSVFQLLARHTTKGCIFGKPQLVGNTSVFIYVAILTSIS